MDLSGSWSYIEDTARSRLKNNKTVRHISDYGESIEMIGVAGEIVVRRFLGLSEDVHNRFDHGVDIDYYGMRLDVKATVLTPNASFRFLQWPEWKRVKCDFIVMTAVDPINQIGTVIGYATKAEILAAPINRNRPTPCHEIPFTKLHPAWELTVEAVRHLTRQAMEFHPLETRSRAGLSTTRPSKPRGSGTGSASRV